MRMHQGREELSGPRGPLERPGKLGEGGEQVSPDLSEPLKLSELHLTHDEGIRQLKRDGPVLSSC